MAAWAPDSQAAANRRGGPDARDAEPAPNIAVSGAIRDGTPNQARAVPN